MLVVPELAAELDVLHQTMTIRKVSFEQCNMNFLQIEVFGVLSLGFKVVCAGRL